MNRIFAVAIVLASSLFAVVPAPAQDGRTLQAKVPFAFIVGKSSLPAGSYRIDGDRNDISLVSLKNSDKGGGAFLMGTPDQAKQGSDSVLVFHKYGNEYFLSQIRSGTTHVNLTFRPTKAEKRARSRVDEAGLSVNDPVLIAMNR